MRKTEIKYTIYFQNKTKLKGIVVTEYGRELLYMVAKPDTSQEFKNFFTFSSEKTKINLAIYRQ